jgi:ABC-type multidrug transport system fused ATPase/permease subunit
MRAFACTAAILQGNKVGKKVPTQVSSRDKKAEYRGASGTLSHEEEDMQSWCKSTNSAIKSKGYWALVKLLWKVHYSAFFTLGLLKALTSVAGFGGPIVLGLLVDYIESNPMESISKGVKLVALLALSFIASAWLNTAFNVHAFVTKGKIRGGLTTAVFDRALALPGHAWSDVDLSDAKLTTLIQVDVDRVSNIITSIHDLWTLPLQLIVAFTLLYFRVNIAFLAGVAIIIILIPINTKIATAINSATSEMMKAKDKRVKVLSEAIRSMRGVKMLGLEDSIEALSREQRDLEMKYLSKRKYLDAVCVFLWASTPVIVPFVVFTTTELLGMKLSASKVFTTLALLNMLIFPMNAFSWVINGFIEARVSLRRVAAVLINRDGSRLLLCGQDDCDDQSRDGYAAYSVVTPMTNGISGQEFPLSSVDSIVEPTQSLIPFSNLRASDGTAPAEILVKQGPAGTPPVEQKSGSVLEQVMAVDPQHIEYEPPQESDTLLPVGMKSTESIDKNEYDGKITVAADNITFTSVALQLKYATWSVGGHNSALEEHGSTYHYPANKNTNAVDVDTPSDFTVGPITLSVGRGQLLGIVGGTGSGKSSLLLGLLGELRQVGGDIEGAMVSLKDLHSAGSSINSVIQHSSPQTQSRNIQKKHSNSFGISQVQYSVNDLEIEDKQRSPGASLRASYCPQSPVIHSGSVRDNIVMGQALDVHWYSRVLEGCQLNHDIHAGNWLQGDLHDCGESGSNLSGGQRLRIGIARAIYSMQPAVLLDDPLSALDGSTAEALQSFIRTVVCKEQNRLVIIATHAVQSLRGADKIVVLERGEAVATGKYDDLSEKNLQFQKLMGATALRINKLVDMSEPEETKEGICDTEGVAESAVVLVSATEDDAAEVSAVDRVHAGHISSGVYGTYFRSVGITATIVIILCTLIMQALSNGMSIWYAYWVTHRGNFSTEKFITISGIILGGSVIFTFLRSVLFAFGCLRAARIMYQKLMESILGAEVKFFEVTSIGKIVNRFGKDTFCIDDQLPFMLNIVLAQMVLLLGAFAVICYTDPLVIPVVLAVFIVYFYLQRFYRVSSRVLRRLDSAYQSPLYTVVCDCAANAVCLRSLRPEVVTHFHRELQRALDGALRTSLGVNLASQVNEVTWLLSPISSSIQDWNCMSISEVITLLMKFTFPLCSLHSGCPCAYNCSGLSFLLAWRYQPYWFRNTQVLQCPHPYWASLSHTLCQ